MATKKVVKVIPLSEVTDEEFAPYGQIMGRVRAEPSNIRKHQHYWANNVDLGAVLDKVDCGLLITNTNGRDIKYFERHSRISENFVPTEGESIFVMAPPNNSKETPDPSEIVAFYLDGTLGVALNIGTWHWPPIPLGKEAKFVLLRKGEIDDKTEMSYLEDFGLDKIVLSFGD
ncbi:MAG: ureidoglycolate lyase [Sphaerochaetaceae bacterium]|nr:ureidoglycolate lyase [Sphaerochaetaceae bacterium]